MTADLAVIDTAAIERLDPAQREAAVTAYLTDARDRLALALTATGPDAVSALKAEIATAAEATKQLGLSKEIQSDAIEMVRRAEFALGKAIRAGQERGEIRRRGQNGGGIHVPGVRGAVARSSTTHTDDDDRLKGPGAFASLRELSGNGVDGAGIYEMVDGITDTQFDAALNDAKAEGNLSRANVVRKIKGVKSEGLTPVEKLVKIRELAPTGRTSDQIAREIGTTEDYVRRTAKSSSIDIPADRVMRGTRRLDHTKFVNETVAALEGLAAGLDVLDLGQADPDRYEDWVLSLTDSLRALNRLRNQIKEMTQ